MNSQGPVFLFEPPYKFAFSNVTGGSISCSGAGHPAPEVRKLLEFFIISYPFSIRFPHLTFHLSHPR